MVASQAPPGNLPLQPTSLIGREQEVVELAGALTKTRLLTLTGVGGVGKTRLALAGAVASSAQRGAPDSRGVATIPGRRAFRHAGSVGSTELCPDARQRTNRRSHLRAPRRHPTRTGARGGSCEGRAGGCHCGSPR